MILIKFGMVGILNTILGLSIIIAALAVGVGDYAANALGYGIGIIISYFLNRSWTFAAPGPPSAIELTKFLIVFCISYSINLFIVIAFRSSGYSNQPFTHFVAIAAYTSSFYLLSRYIIFANTMIDNGVIIHKIKKMNMEFIVITMISAGLLPFLLRIPLTHDVIWQLWIAKQILSGAKLYQDILEVNPPLWFWSALPVVRWGDILDIPPSRLLIFVVWSMSTISTLLVGYLSDEKVFIKRILLMLGVLWVTLVAPIYDFGQREQIALICSLPYASLIVRRVAGSKIYPGLALLIGIIGSYGFALKHYFILIPISLELWLLIRQKRDWKIIRPETLALTFSALIYAIFIILFAYPFFTEMVPMIGIAYHGYEGPWQDIVIRPWFCFWIAGIAFFIVYGRGVHGCKDDLITAFLILSSFFAISYFIQNKGWLYHSVPVSGCLAIALIIRLNKQDVRKAIPVISGIIVLFYIVIVPKLTGVYWNYYQSEVDPLLAKVQPGEPILAITGDPMWIWPMAQNHNLVWPSRFYAYWMIPAIARAETIGPYPAALRDLAYKAREEAATELQCSAPAMLLFERDRNYTLQPTSFHVRDFFLRQRQIKSFLSEYYLEQTPTSSLYIYRRIKKPGRLQGNNCPQLLLTPFRL